MSENKTSNIQRMECLYESKNVVLIMYLNSFAYTDVLLRWTNGFLNSYVYTESE